MSPVLNEKFVKHAGVELGDDGEHAEQRDHDAGELPAGEPVAEHRSARGGNENRPERVHHRHVERRGQLQADELQRPEYAAADQREIDQNAETLADQRPVAHQVCAHKWKQDRGREQPAQRGDPRAAARARRWRGPSGDCRTSTNSRAPAPDRRCPTGHGRPKPFQAPVRHSSDGFIRARRRRAGSAHRGCRCRRGTAPRRRRSPRR